MASRIVGRALSPGTRHLLPVVCLPNVQATSPWGFARIGRHRHAWLANAIQNLLQAFPVLRRQLFILRAPNTQALPALARAVGASTVVCEEIAAPEEQAEVAALRAAGLQVRTVWHSSLLHPDQLPWSVQQLPGVFTPFRQAVEAMGLQPPAPLPPPAELPAWPPGVPEPSPDDQAQALAALAEGPAAADARSAFPYLQAGLQGGEAAALAHRTHYPARGERSLCAVLSAKVGSIGDNRLGGWYGYRASKAALNMLLKTAAIEMARTHPQAVLAALHPGTVDSALSAPFRGAQIGRPAADAARDLLAVLDGLQPEDSGGFWAYDGQRLPW